MRWQSPGGGRSWTSWPAGSDGRRRMYRFNGYPLKPIHDWVKSYEQSWSQRFGRLDAVLAELSESEQGDGGSDE